MQRRIAQLAQRYLPGEVIGTLTALAAATLARHFGHSPLVIAIAAAWGENIGFYSYNLLAQAARHGKTHEALYGHHRYLLLLWQSSRDVALEFGSAELFDSLLLRPFFMYQAPLLLGHFATGIILGKLAADIAFYAVAFCAFQVHTRLSQWLGRRRLRRRTPPSPTTAVVPPH